MMPMMNEAKVHIIIIILDLGDPLLDIGHRYSAETAYINLYQMVYSVSALLDTHSITYKKILYM